MDVPLNESLLAVNVMSSLGLTINTATGKVTSVIMDGQSRELPAIVGYQHCIKLKPDAELTRPPLRRLSLSVRADVSAELQRLLQTGSIERNKASEWISLIVIARKSQVKYCSVDLRPEETGNYRNASLANYLRAVFTPGMLRVLRTGPTLSIPPVRT